MNLSSKDWLELAVWAITNLGVFLVAWGKFTQKMKDCEASHAQNRQDILKLHERHGVSEDKILTLETKMEVIKASADTLKGVDIKVDNLTSVLIELKQYLSSLHMDARPAVLESVAKNSQK
jgi:hypothetical protein